VQVAETTVKRYNLLHQILTGVIFIEFLLLITVGAGVWFGIGKGLEPLQRLQGDIATRSPRDLRPIREAHAPVEMHSVVRALNDLLLQLASALRTQQQFVANAAHQLRTPLAGLRMQVEYGLRQDNPLEWRRTLETLGSVTERTVHLANQLLTLARTEAGSNQLASMRRLDLRSIVEQVVEQWMPKAIAKDIDLGLGLEAAVVHGDPFLIGELLSNLLDNAISYTPAGGGVTVRSMRRGGATILEVEDNGVGIQEEEREKVFTRFYRIAGSPGEGCGLGLAIVREIAYLHQGSATIRSPSGGCGTLVAVRFPAADDSQEMANVIDAAT
jgi:two-component system, OmpR family, sensor histidine kinase TctE